MIPCCGMAVAASEPPEAVAWKEVKSWLFIKNGRCATPILNMVVDVQGFECI